MWVSLPSSVSCPQVQPLAIRLGMLHLERGQHVSSDCEAEPWFLKIREGRRKAAAPSGGPGVCPGGEAVGQAVPPPPPHGDPCAQIHIHIFLAFWTRY